MARNKTEYPRGATRHDVMSWTILALLVLVLGFLSAIAFLRRAELGGMRQSLEDRATAIEQGSLEAQLQHPVVDLSRCMGCSTCVAVCPETGVLEIVHGQAVVVNGAGCMGISACERECPVGAITVTLSNVETRMDIPAIDDRLEAVGTPGLFLAGEVTAQALIRTAIEHGTAIAAEVGRRTRETDTSDAAEHVLDLIIIGAGPAGLACALEAKQQGLRSVTIDQADNWGGTVAKYPRQKLVLTQPVDLPLHGRLKQTSYSKEELMALWLDVAQENELPFLGGRTFESMERDEQGNFVVLCADERYAARQVCIAIGRRGTPRKLGVPGEDLSKVTYSLVDAGSFQRRRVLVVGGGDSAVETALSLSSQPGNEVGLSYRKEAFHRIRSRNARKLDEAVQQGRIALHLRSEVGSIHADHVQLKIAMGEGTRTVSIPNDDVFVMVGGVAPVATLEAAGVSFDPSLRPKPQVIGEQGSGLATAMRVAFVCALLVLGFALWHSDYYFLSTADRPAHGKHKMLRPGESWGLAFGVAALGLVMVNLAYLLRRSPRIGVVFGTLKSWMTVHVATGIAAVLFAMLHSAMAPRDTVGGHSLWMLVGLLATGAIGRYFYAYVPRAANGRELALEELRGRARALPESWGAQGQAFGNSAHTEILDMMQAHQWRGSFVGRMAALFGDRRAVRRSLARIELAGLHEQVPGDQIEQTLQLVRDAHKESLAAAHFEDLRALANTWRYLHRWGAVLMVILVLLHVAHALIYGDYFGGGA